MALSKMPVGFCQCVMLWYDMICYDARWHSFGDVLIECPTKKDENVRFLTEMVEMLKYTSFHSNKSTLKYCHFTVCAVGVWFFETSY